MSNQKVTPTDPSLWTKVRAFDFDAPMSEYGFTIRLIDENHWTILFAEKAILEYKKFMYLAAISDSMVSPSPVIDAVWHQHLIFTQSYSQFCEMLGKFIQHVPSTHNRDDHKKFMQAKLHTVELYKENFGDIPADIWETESMYDTVGWPKAKLKIRGFVLLGILGIVLSLVPSYYALRPLYVHIEGQYFLVMYIILAVIIFLALFRDSAMDFDNKIKTLSESSFVYNLSPSELVYLKTRDLNNVVDDQVNQLINSHKLSEDNGFIYAGKVSFNNKELLEYQISEELKGGEGKIKYSELRQRLIKKPVFTTVSGSMNAIDKYFVKSKEFGKIFYKHFVILSLLLILGIVRVATGIMRDRPFIVILFLVLVLGVAVVIHLQELTKRISKSRIPRLYYESLLSEQHKQQATEWRYFRLGSSALSAGFFLVAEPRIRSNDSGYSSADISDSGGDSCGSSCGSSCGGCGGGD
jgi:hypothetical protein